MVWCGNRIWGWRAVISCILTSQEFSVLTTVANGNTRCWRVHMSTTSRSTCHYQTGRHSLGLQCGSQHGGSRQLRTTKPQSSKSSRRCNEVNIQQGMKVSIFLCAFLFLVPMVSWHALSDGYGSTKTKTTRIWNPIWSVFSVSVCTKRQSLHMTSNVCDVIVPQPDMTLLTLIKGLLLATEWTVEEFHLTTG